MWLPATSVGGDTSLSRVVVDPDPADPPGRSMNRSEGFRVGHHSQRRRAYGPVRSEDRSGPRSGLPLGAATGRSSVNRLARITVALVGNNGAGSLVGAVCKTAVDVIGVDAAGLSILAEGNAGTICAYGRFAAAGEELQFTLGEGPCRDAFASEVLVEATDLGAHESRWPVFSPALLDLGVRSVASFPVRIGGARLGALSVYRTRTGSLAPEQVLDGYVVAQVAAHAIVAAQAKVSDDAMIDEIEAGFARMEPVHQATGMVMAQLGISAEDALARLRATAYVADRSVHDLARDIIDRRIDLTGEL